MDKIATPSDLITQLTALKERVSSEPVSRDVVASELRSLADKVSGLPTDYEGAKKIRDLAESEVKAAAEILKKFPSLSNGLTPDNVRSLPEYRAAKARSDKAFAHLRKVNTWFLKNFKKEIQEDRALRRR